MQNLISNFQKKLQKVMKRKMKAFVMMELLIVLSLASTIGFFTYKIFNNAYDNIKCSNVVQVIRIILISDEEENNEISANNNMIIKKNKEKQNTFTISNCSDELLKKINQKARKDLNSDISVEKEVVR